jgi:hypothetical protein
MMDASTERKLTALRALADRPGTPGEGAAAEAAIDRINARHHAPSLVPSVLAVPVDPLIGLLLRLDRTCDRRGGCCQHTGAIEAGRGPHRYALRCDQCGRHRGWIPAAAADVLLALYRRGDLGTSPILRDGGIVP